MRKKDKEKILLLFGAGATIPWGGKTSIELTNDIIKTEKYTYRLKKSNECIGFALKRFLSQYYRISEDSVNFEMILEVIEDIWSHYYHKDLDNPRWFRPPTPCFYNLVAELDDNIVIDNQQIFSHQDDSPNISKCLTFGNLYGEIIDNIFSQVTSYSTNFNNISNYPIGLKLSEFVNQMRDRYVLRTYTLNYDNMLLKIPEIKPFFYGQTNKSNGFDYYRIINDVTSDCFYNLHGSIFFSSTNINGTRYELAYDELTRTALAIDLPKNLLNYPILAYPILTGHNKFAKTLIEPMNAFNFSFRRDCLMAKKIYLIGYSFNDPHVNNCIYSSLKSNPEQKIYIVSKCNIENKSVIEDELSRTLFQNSKINLNKEGNWLYDIICNICFYIDGFEQFLSSSDKDFAFNIS